MVPPKGQDDHSLQAAAAVQRLVSVVPVSSSRVSPKKISSINLCKTLPRTALPRTSGIGSANSSSGGTGSGTSSISTALGWIHWIFLVCSTSLNASWRKTSGVCSFSGGAVGLRSPSVRSRLGTRVDRAAANPLACASNYPTYPNSVERRAGLVHAYKQRTAIGCVLRRALGSRLP